MSKGRIEEKELYPVYEFRTREQDESDYDEVWKGEYVFTLSDEEQERFQRVWREWEEMQDRLAGLMRGT